MDSEEGIVGGERRVKRGMPRLISKQEATERIARDQGSLSCALCALCQIETQARYWLEETKHCIALLPQYARQWGHVMILFREHVTTYQQLSFEQWSEASVLALKAAKAAEKALAPVRCYIASLGAAVEHPMTFPHLHLHMIPTYSETDTPSTIFTTKDGVLTAEAHEWEALYQKLKRAMKNE
jgi:diadenosine tetraphosphate (Ap4A) HIT family hydrolase